MLLCHVCHTCHVRQVGIVTFSSQLHFYKLGPTLRRPHMVVQPDVVSDDGAYIPVPEDLLVHVHDSQHLLLMLLDSLPKVRARL